MSMRRDHILSCAWDLYLKVGLEGFSMRKLAVAVGVTAPALYRYYENREHVIADVVREAHHAFAASLYRALEGRTPLERMAKAGEGYLDFALEHPRWYEILFTAPERLGMEHLPDDIEAQGSAVHQFWVDRVREAQDAGLMGPGDPTQISLTMWAHAHGMLVLYHHGVLQMDEETFRRTIAASGRRMLVGLATEVGAREMEEAWGEAIASGEGARP